MDQSAVSYFVQKFGSYDSEELGELVARRGTLSDEAIEALDQVLAKKGLKDSEVFVPPVAPTPPMTEEVQKSVEDETRAARALWRGGLATACKVTVGLVFIAPVLNFTKAASIGGLLAGLMVVVAGYVGYLVGRTITRNICANGDISIDAKKKRLRIMFALLFPIHFFIYGISQLIFFKA